MTPDLELQLFQEIAELKRKLAQLQEKKVALVPTYSFSKITFEILENLVALRQEMQQQLFATWFSFPYVFSTAEILFLQQLISANQFFIDSYHEEDLKAKVIIPILNAISFVLINEGIRDFYEGKLYYRTDSFIMTGSIDFMIAKGLHQAKHPYFFIQEFKKSIKNDDPRPQLLAELIAAVELNHCTMMRGAYIVGAIWNFVILEKIGTNKYCYAISENFDCTKIDDLKGIYRNLFFVKDEICASARREVPQNLMREQPCSSSGQERIAKTACN